MRWTRTDSFAVFALLLTFLFSRWIWLHDLPASAFYFEEAYRWIAVQELVNESPVSASDLQADHYQGGSLVAILLARAIAVVAGTGLGTLKLAALVFSSGILVMLYLIGRRFFGRLAGGIAGSIYVCGPPLVAYWGVCLMGFHSEAILLSLILVYATFALVTNSWSGDIAWVATGAIATLGVWFTPTAGLAVVSCGLAWLVLKGVPGRKNLVAGSIGAGLGLAPWLLYNVTRGWVGLDRPMEVFLSSQSNDIFRTQSLWDRSIDFAIRFPGQGLLDPGGILTESPWRPVLFIGVLGPASIALLAGLQRLTAPRQNESKHGPDSAKLEIVFWIYAAVFTLAYLASRFTLELDPRPIAFRLHVSLAVFMIMPIAISAANGLRRSGSIRIASGVATMLCLLSLASATTAMAIRFEASGTPLTRDIGYVVLGRLAQRKFPRPLERPLKEVKWISQPDDLRSAKVGIGWGITEYYEQAGSLEELIPFIDKMSEEPAVLRGMRWGVNSRLRDLNATGNPASDPDLERSVLRMRAIKSLLSHPDSESNSSEFYPSSGNEPGPDESIPVPPVR